MLPESKTHGSKTPGSQTLESKTLGSKTLEAPKFLFVPVYNSCNLRCPHCTFWERPHSLGRSWADGDHAERQLRVVEDFASARSVDKFPSANSAGIVVTHGGESLMAWDKYFRLSRRVRELGLRLFTVTNGTMVATPDDAKELVVDGPSEVSVSLDSIRPAVHDRLRGVPGAFDRAVRGLRLILEAREKWCTDTRVYVMLLLGKSTCDDLDASYEFGLRTLGVDKVKLNAVQPSFGRNEGDNPLFALECEVDPDRLRESLRRVDAAYDLGFNPAWVDQVVAYFRTLGVSPRSRRSWSGDLTTSGHICGSYDRNIWLSDRSEMHLCCDFRWPGTEWKEPGDVAKFWGSVQALRGQMAGCDRLCGISHSVRAASSTLFSSVVANLTR